MLHACFTPFASCFVYTSWHFYAISGTNLLTRCHSASSLFFCCFVFQKSYTGNLLGIGRNEDPNSYFSWTKDEDRKRAGGGPEGRLTMRGRAPLLAAPRGGEAPGGPLTPPLCLFKASISKTLKESLFFPKQFRSAAAVEPCRDGEVPPEPSSSPSPPSPSTSLPSPSPLLPAMMRRE
jgi:hypothetical protein